MSNGIVNMICRLEDDIDRIGKIVEEDPTDELEQKRVDLLWQLANSYLINRNYDLAEKAFRIIVELRPLDKRKEFDDATNVEAMGALLDLYRTLITHDRFIATSKHAYDAAFNVELLGAAVGLYELPREKSTD